ncbi:glycosyltransferase involved in cell wall biosynthesis [Flavobacterium limicola]|uniref:Glycosyltransferase involved in cell wall biosynthesis n=1 Tax=Flavobacterium limicola TaxID=180441 RepID=A0A495S3Z7_9FLAO|nr:glycosyltransferase family 4 protein [Flavobacterium limicola]RKS94563.1 glycosyltransferase involved in cell wall biosynthesis [Flavobacterium limicola]
MRIIAIHLLNDYSGSPKVLMQLLNGWSKRKIETHLYTCSGRDGFLSGIDQVKNHFFWYRLAKNSYLRLLFFMTSQLILFVQLVFKLQQNDIVYINTVLPFGAAIAGKLRGCKVIYHIHETTMKPKILKLFLFKIVKITASEVVYVSNFIANQEPLNIKKNILYNVLESSFVKQSLSNFNTEKKTKTVLMICSLKRYKGVNEFLKLAQVNSNFTFKLVVNATQNEINNYFKKETIPSNLIVYPTQKNTHYFYKEASIVLNLSDTNLWVETFGLTILEAMAYGLPTIVPPVGGVTELVFEGKNGHLIDSKNISLISKKLNMILSDSNLYALMSKDALAYSQFFSEDYFENESAKIISN